MLSTVFNLNDIVIPFLYVFLFVLVVYRANGISTILSFLLRYFKISYSDRKMKALDSKWFNIQLFRFLNGINVSNIEDARMIQEKLNTGELNISMFQFIKGFGDVTSEISIGKKYFMYFSFVLMIAIGAFIFYGQSFLKYDYKKVDTGSFSYFISIEKVIVDLGNENSRTYTKKDCRKLQGVIPSRSNLDIACNNLLDAEDVYNNDLDDEIKEITKAKRAFEFLSYAYCILGFFYLITFHRFTKVNKLVRDFKFKNK